MKYDQVMKPNNENGKLISDSMPVDVFISHHTQSCLLITQAIANTLEKNRIRCWYAPRDTKAAYAASIVDAIKSCKIFVLVLNRQSSFSQDVLNEINLAFDRVRNGENIVILPFHISTEEISKDAYYYIGRMHWIDAITPPMEEHIRELVLKIKSLLNIEISGSTNSYMKGNSLIVNYNFIGRKQELKKMEDVLAVNRIVFLCGIGGCGKTELAKQYAIVYSDKYEDIYFLQYESSLKNLIISDKYFTFDDVRRTVEDGKVEDDVSFSHRKLNAIKKIFTQKTLIILDNFDVLEDELLEDFLEGPYQVIITSRINFYYIGLPVMEIKNLKSTEQLKLFRQNYQRSLSKMEKSVVYDIIEYLQGHTMAIELVARLMNSKRIRPEDMLYQLKENGISPEISGNVKHGFSKGQTIYEYIQTMFCLDRLTESEKQIMKNLSVLPVSGVSVENFMKWCELKDGEVINSLIDRNWIRYNLRNDYISLHPLISDVIHNSVEIDSEYFHTMNFHLDCMFKISWSMSKDDKDTYSEIARSLYFQYKKNKGQTIYSLRCIFQIFKNCDCYDLCKQILADMKDSLDDSQIVELAWWYWDYGDLAFWYHNYDLAITYTRKALSILGETGREIYDMAFMLKHLSHIYHAFYQNANADKQLLALAHDCLDKSENFYNKALENEDTQWGSYCYSYALDLDKEHESQIASRCYAYGINYYLSEEYELAEKYSIRSFKIYKDLNGEIDSDTTAPLRILALIYARTGRFDEAISTERKVIAVRKQLWGIEQFRYFEQLEALADIYFQAGRFYDAVAELRNLIESIGEENKRKYGSYVTKIQQKMQMYECSVKNVNGKDF